MSKNEQFARTAKNVWAYIAAFLRWSLLGLVVGGCGGLVGAAFSKAVAYATTPVSYTHLTLPTTRRV